MPYGKAYGINDQHVTPPDEESWLKLPIGDNLSGLQNRSPYQVLQWSKRVVSECDLDWFQFDNTDLTSITATSPDHTRQFTRYTTDQKCQSVTKRDVHGVGVDVVATFLIFTG